MLRKALCVGAVCSADDALRTSLREGAIVSTEQLERTAALPLARAVVEKRLWTTCCITSGLSDEAAATTFIQEMAADKKDGQSFSFPMFGMRLHSRFCFPSDTSHGYIPAPLPTPCLPTTSQNVTISVARQMSSFFLRFLLTPERYLLGHRSSRQPIWNNTVKAYSEYNGISGLLASKMMHAFHREISTMCSAKRFGFFRKQA